MTMHVDAQHGAAPGRSLHAAVERLAREAPLERKLLVCRTRGEGRELLRALALRGIGWIGFEPTTPLELASRIVAIDLAREGKTAADEFDVRALTDEAIDAALSKMASPRLAELAEAVGLRDALANSVQALRLAGIDARRAGKGIQGAEKRRLLPAILEHYENALHAGSQVDNADVLQRAIAALESGRTPDPGARVCLMPDLRTRGLSGRFVRLLREGGAEILPTEPVHGLEPPAIVAQDDEHAAAGSLLSYLHDIDRAPQETANDVELHLFAASSVETELREVLRRVMAAGRRWDEIEIVATDPIAYGCTLDALATRLGIPVTYAVGLPIERTRQGRAAGTYLRWIQTDFPATLFRQLLETGDIAPRPFGEARVGGWRLARRLRRLRIGWGRDRYLKTIDRVLAGLDDPPDDERWTPEELAERRAREREELEALREVVAPILAATPALAGRLDTRPVPVSPADLAKGLLGFLTHVPAPTPVEVEARERMTEQLERVAARLTRKTSLGAAVTILRSHLQIRVPSPGTEGPLPWSSAGTALHFADLEHGGYTGRPMTFVVGLDAERFPGAGLPDPILLDDDRRALSREDLPSSAERNAERRHLLAALLARLRGTATLSYSAWSAAEGREVAPAAEMLQAFRLQKRDPAKDYEALAKALKPFRSGIPRDAGRLDAADVWLDALQEDGILVSGLPAVRAAYPGLSAGLAARDARQGPTFTPHDGRIDPRPELLDPRRNQEIVLSKTAAEGLGACPLYYLHRYVLDIDPPDDPEFDPGVWLDSLKRGSLLHEVYEGVLKRARAEGIAYGDQKFETLARDVFDREIERYRGLVPAPSDKVYEDEVQRLRDDLDSFVEMIRERGANWIEPLERWFGYRKDTPPVEIALSRGVIRAGGRIDRVDELADGRVMVVDYKTGGTYGHGKKFGTYDGGRSLQHVLYTRAAPALYEREVAGMEFHFPSVRGQNHVETYTLDRLRDGEVILDALFDVVARGLFVPTESKNDCTFCEYHAICRVRVDDRKNVDSPRAAWGEKHHEKLAEYETLRLVRGIGK